VLDLVAAAREERRRERRERRERGRRGRREKGRLVNFMRRRGAW
jgi:hypothetical protein